jgi:acyl-CoA reductase-like NAD-dependent aldehyde dehydrogenase
VSGLGRELGEEGIEEFWQTKYVQRDIDEGYEHYWYPN